MCNLLWVKNSAAISPEYQQDALSGQMGPMVNFVVGGVQKAGTTAIYDILSQHPDIYMPATKELHYFDRDNHFTQQHMQYEYYHQHFAKRKPEQLCGEATPAYIYRAQAVERIQSYNPDMKWIVLLRHPVKRAYSQWNMQRSRGIESLSFEEAVAAEPNRQKTLSDTEKHKYAYTARSTYAPQITRLLQHFEKSQCLFLTNESILDDFDSSLTRLMDFLALDAVAIKPAISHKGNYTSTLSDGTLAKLGEQFSQDIADTAAMTGLDLNHWFH